MIKTYIFLILAIFFEVAWTMLLQLLNFTKLITSILTVCYILFKQTLYTLHA